MLSILKLAAATLVASAALVPAMAINARQTNDEECGCLTPATAAYLVNSFATLLNSTFSKSVAADILSPTLIDNSDSINFLVGAPPGGPTFSSEASFAAGQGSLPPITFRVDSIDAVTCDNIAWRWTAFPGGPNAPSVRGIEIFYTVPDLDASSGRQISELWVEFNSATWVNDIGGNCTLPKSG